MTLHLAKDGILARRTAEKSLELLTMLQRKTLGNLDETERDALHRAQTEIAERLKSLSKAEGLN